ncbi:MAG: OmpA family protein, partial [Bacteroidetes bacterium]|nr:OmpA family protein [Bacteroidota bacterium]
MLRNIIIGSLILLFVQKLSAQNNFREVVYFSFDRYELTPESKRKLDIVIKKFNLSNLVNEVKIYGHTDSVGRGGYNDSLSLKRANAVDNYLREHGINGEIISTIEGYGERNPININNRQLNRRVEVIISEKEKIKDTVTRIENAKKWPKEKYVDINMDSLKVGESISLKNIQFYPGKHRFKPE